MASSAHGRKRKLNPVEVLILPDGLNYDYSIMPEKKRKRCTSTSGPTVSTDASLDVRHRSFRTSQEKGKFELGRQVFACVEQMDFESEVIEEPCIFYNEVRCYIEIQIY